MNDIIRNMLKYRLQWVSAALIIALMLESAPAFAAPPLQSAQPTLQSCSSVSEESLQSELNVVTQQVFAEQLKTLDLDAVVEKQWVTLGMDAVMDSAVDQAVERVKGETDLWNQFLSGWSPDKAKELTLAVASYAFDAPDFRIKMDDLSAAVSQDVADRLAVASADSVSAALYCLQTFIGRNYSKALVSAFEDRVQQATTSANLLGDKEIGPDVLALVGEHEMALGGVGVIIAAQITRKIVSSIAQRMSQRVAGRIAGRILGKAGSTVIPVAGWLIGTGMIVYDIYDSREGALPQIQDSLKLEQIKVGVRSEIAASIKPELEAELPGLARVIANDLFVEWRNTKRNIRQVLDLAAQNKAFADILAEMQSPDQVARLVDLVSIVQQSGGPGALDTSIGDGTLQRVALLPASAATIVEDSGSLQTALAWYETVGNRLNDVVAMELYKQTSPDMVDLGQLDALLALGDKTAVSRLSLLEAEKQTELLRLPTEPLVQLANLLAPDQLSWLATELPNLDASQRNQLVARMLSQPGVTPSLQALGNLSQLAAAGNLDKAITFVAGAKDPVAYWTDTLAVVTGDVPANLFWAKHGPWPSLGAIGALLLVFLVALRLAYGAGAWLVAPLSIFVRRRR